MRVLIYIGEFCLEPVESEDEESGQIWIAKKGGEGGQFSEKALAEVIARFYAENF